MKFEFSKQSKLHGRTVNEPMVRYSHVPKNEDNNIEHIFVYDKSIPSPELEPALYDGATVLVEHTEEIQLRYNGLNEVVMLLTRKADNKFREEHSELVAQNEMFRIDE